MTELGIIEGYFGRAWTWEERADVVSTLAPAGYRFFHYAPKIDGRLRRNWRQLYDGQSLADIAAFAVSCRSLDMRFGVGLTPFGVQHAFGDDERAALKAKLAQLNTLQLDDLAILFDDMDGDIPDLASRQAEVVRFITDHNEAKRFFLCPSYYSDDPVLDRVFGRRPDDYLATLGRLIDPAVAIYWTGEEVCSAEIGADHLDRVAEQLRRKPALWDNYPVNDGPRMSQYLHIRGTSGRDPSVIGDKISHHAINPALQPTLGCIPALTLSRRYADPSTYRYLAATQSAARDVCGDKLADMIIADLLTLQQSGLDRLTDPQRQRLHDRYAPVDHAAAQEIVSWLNGGYAITGEMLQTQ